MYLEIITTAAYIASTLFVLLLIKTFYKTSPVQLWKMAVQRVKTALQIKSQLEKAKARGEREFLFRNGTVSIYAQTSFTALYKFRQFVKNEKAQKLAALKKVKPKKEPKKSVAQRFAKPTKNAI